MTSRTRPSARPRRWSPLEWIVAAVVALAITATVADSVGEPEGPRHAAAARPDRA